jgi:predicted amidophosphoribosyltransferase
MFCSACGSHVEDGEHFCSNCGASLQAVGGVLRQAPAPVAAPERPRGKSKGSVRPKNPYREQIQQLRLQIRQLKLNLKQINTSMSQTRAHYNETAAFLPWPIREGAKMFEDINLLNTQPQKEQLQQQILVLEQQLLSLQQAEMEWKRQQGLT